MNPGAIMTPALIVAALFISCCSVLVEANVRNFTTHRRSDAQPAGRKQKIAFLFLTRGIMPLEDIWREFFHWRVKPDEYSIYVHTHPGFSFPPTSFFYKRDIQNKVSPKWGSMSEVEAIRNLVSAGLEDPDNTWFCLLSESCIPLVPFPKWSSAMLAHNQSIVNACPYDLGSMEPTRWRPALDANPHMKLEYWRKGANWFALIRSHAAAFVEHHDFDIGWEAVPNADEHYLPSLFASLGLENETTCSDGFVHVNWPSATASHPHTYTADQIGPDLFKYFQKPIKQERGFNFQCSGFPELCHFTARKFNGACRYQLLENLEYILSEPEHPYTGNPWDHHKDKLRKDSDGKYYLIENNLLREITDITHNATFAALHIQKEWIAEAALLQPIDYKVYSAGPAIPLMVDGTLIKKRKDNEVWILKDGHRHSIPNMDTFWALKLRPQDIQIWGDADIDQISVGAPMPKMDHR